MLNSPPIDVLGCTGKATLFQDISDSRIALWKVLYGIRHVAKVVQQPTLGNVPSCIVGELCSELLQRPQSCPCKSRIARLLQEEL